MYKSSRAESTTSASNAAVLVIIIALLIVLYVLMLPPDAREQLLGPTDASTPTGDGASNVLMRWTPPTQTSQVVDSRPLPYFSLKTELRGDVLSQRSGISVERSVFHATDQSMEFAYPRNAQEVLLSFSVAQAQGELEILLNGEVLVQQEITSRQPAPIRLPISALNQTNELVFRVSSVGFAFWKTNSYELEQVQVTADVTDVSRSQHTQRFVLQDAQNVEFIRLGFVADCFDQSGAVTLAFNGLQVYNGYPSCGVPIQVDLPVQELSPVQNTLAWSIEQGEYIFDQVEVQAAYAQKDAVGSFELSSALYQEIQAQNQDVQLRLQFAGANSRGVLVVNGERLAFNTQEQSFSGIITSYVQQGTNTIRVDSSSTPIALIEARIQ